MKNNYEKIIELNGEKQKINIEIKDLKPKAVQELRVMGYSYDTICNMLKIGKMTAIKFQNEKEVNINSKWNMVIQIWRLFIVFGIKHKTPTI